MHLIYGILEKPVHSLQAINISAIQRGLQRVQLLKPNITVPELPSDRKTMELTAPNIVIPSEMTTYWCYMAELPAGFPKHHIIMVRGRRGFLSLLQFNNHVHIQLFCNVHLFPALSQAFRPIYLLQQGTKTSPRAIPPASSILMSLRDSKVRSFSAGGGRQVTSSMYQGRL